MERARTGWDVLCQGKKVLRSQLSQLEGRKSWGLLYRGPDKTDSGPPRACLSSRQTLGPHGPFSRIRVPRKHPSSLFLLRCSQSPEPRFPPRTDGVHGQLGGGGPGTQQACPGAQQRQRGPHRGAQCSVPRSDLGVQPAGGRWSDASLRPGDTGYFPAPSLLCIDLFLEGKGTNLGLVAGPVVRWEGCSVFCIPISGNPIFMGVH